MSEKSKTKILLPILLFCFVFALVELASKRKSEKPLCITT